jgi:hypothetical protein
MAVADCYVCELSGCVHLTCGDVGLIGDYNRQYAVALRRVSLTIVVVEKQ